MCRTELLLENDMIKGSISKWLTGLAACGLAVGAMATPFSVKYTDTVSAVTPPPGIINGEQVTVEFILDNGNSSAANQTWSAANLKLVCFTFNNAQDKSVSIDYSGSPLTANGSTVVTTGNFTTNASGQLQTGTIDWEDFRDPIPNPHVTNLAGVTTVSDWFIDHFNHVIRFNTGQLGFANVTNDDAVTNWSNPVASNGLCSGGAAIAPPTVAKAFGAATIVLNGSTSLTFTITNPNASSSLGGIFLTDSLPAGLVVSTPNGLVDGCGGATAVAGSSAVDLVDIGLAPNTSCTYRVNVTGTTLGTKNNTTGAVTSDQGTGGTASASVTVVAVAAAPATIPTLQAWAVWLLGLLILVTASVAFHQRRRD